MTGLIALLADSGPMFRRRDGRAPLWDALAQGLPPRPRAAYVGASNGDEVRYFEVFEAAMAVAHIDSLQHVTATFDDHERCWLDGADLIVLAGGDPDGGWQAMTRRGMNNAIAARAAGGAVLLGISAGAIQLGTPWCSGSLGLVEALVDAHDEAAGWERLRHAVRQGTAGRVGLGLPFGTALVGNPGGPLRPIFGAAVEVHA
ncbi:MAG: Type 1 glutamine amidotransferase-like domain-containing protein [Planctomycetota bacterium]